MPRTNDKNKTKEQLIKELTGLRLRIAELERAEHKRKKEVSHGLRGEPQEIIDSVKDGIVLLDLTGKITAINKSITEAAGYAEEDIVGKRLALLKMFPPKSLASMLTAFTRVITGQQTPPYEVEVYTQTGEKLFVEIHGSLLKRGGKKAGVIAALRDITERKRAEEALQMHHEDLEKLVTERTGALQEANKQLQREITERKGIEETLKRAYDELKESEERYRSLVDNIDLPINLIDSAYTISMVNANLSRRLQKTARELIGKKCFREFEHRDAVCPHCPGAQAMATGKPAEVEIEVVRDDGYRNHVRLQAFPVFGHDGSVTGFIEVTEGITERKQIEQALRESEKELQALMDASPIAISWGDLQGNIQYINRKHQELFGYSLEEIPTIAEWRRRADQDPTQRERFSHWEEELMEAHKHGSPLPPWEMTVTCKDGSVRHVMVEGTIVSKHRLVIYNDITERKRMEDELRKSEEWFRLLIQHSADSFVLHDFDGKIIDVNQHTCDSLGYTREELISLSIQDIDQNFIKGKHKEKWNKMILGEPITLEGVHKRKDGTIFPVEIRLGVFESGGHRLMLGMVRDITERVRAEETIRKLAYHDALTGLPNRALFTDRLNRAMAQAHRNRSKFAVMLLDLDHFKNINDTLGHSVGDQLLSSVGKRLTELLRQEDTVSRMGGDEFFLLLPVVDRVQDAATIAQKVLNVFHEPFMLDVHEVHITTSIGVALYPDDGADVKTLLKNADIALYQAKQKGRNNYQQYTPTMDPRFQGDG